MIIALWIINALAALVFLGAGLMKIVRPREALAGNGMAWVNDFSSGTVKLIGAAEVLGALGLVLPLLTGIAPILTPIAAVALILLMIGAVATHLRRKETPAAPAVLTVLLIASAVLGFLVVLGG